MPYHDEKKNIRLCTFSFVKDSQNIVEFIEHYLGLGFDMIYIYDDFSSISVKEVIKDLYGDKITVFELKDYPDYYKKPQIAKYNSIFYSYDGVSDFYDFALLFMEHFCKYMAQYSDYCLFVDDDEYLHLNKFTNIKEVIEYYTPFSQLKINWVLKMSSDLNSSNELKKSTYTNTEKIDQHVKCLFKLDDVRAIQTPHFVYLSNGRITKNILNEKSDDHESPFEQKLVTYSPKELNLYIYHYQMPSITEFIRRRFCRVTANIRQIFKQQTDNNAFACEDALKFIEYTKLNLPIICEYVSAKLHNNNVIAEENFAKLELYKDKYIQLVEIIHYYSSL